jgi:NADH-quinone oxidoreductase subunit K
MNELHNYLVVGGVLFALGAIGFLTRRNLIIMLLSAEMMLHGVSLNLVAFSQQHGNFEGQAFSVFLVTVAACEAGLALALFVALYQRRRTLDAAAWRQLGEDGFVADLPDEAPAPGGPLPPDFSRLTPAGRVPQLPPPGSSRRA